MITAPRLQLSSASRIYNSDDTQYAIKDVSLVIEPGEFVAVVGRSGSGKSTLLNIMGLLDSAWTGEYHIGDVDVSSLSSAEIDHLRGRTFGFVFQSSFANGYETTARNVALGLSVQGLALNEQRQRVAEALELLGLSDKASSLARTLSGGERQRLAIARAFATQPSVIIADEPTGNLDTATGRRVMDALINLNAAGTTIILVTHDLSVAAFASRTVTLSDSRLIKPVEPEGSSIRVRATTTNWTAPPVDSGRSVRWHKALERALRAVNNVTSRPLRSAALIAAFGIAFAGLVGSAGIGTTASNQIATRLSATAGDEVRVDLPASADEVLQRDWADRAARLPLVEGVGQVAYLESKTAAVGRLPLGTGGTREFSGQVLAVGGAADDVLDVKTQPSAAVELLGEVEHRHVALVGVDVADDLAIGGMGIGAEIAVGGVPYEVAGLIIGSDRDPALTSSVVIPIEGLDNSASSQLVVRTASGYAKPIADALPVALSPAAPAEVGVQTAADLRNLRIGVQTDLNGLLGSLSAALLAVAILSGASAMYLSVLSRTQELALSRAVGLSKRGVAEVFLWEGAFIGFAGAMVGVAGGMLVNVGLAAAQMWSAVVPWGAIALTPGAGLLCGALAALVPALRAARIDPSEAIR